MSSLTSKEKALLNKEKRSLLSKVKELSASAERNKKFAKEVLIDNNNRTAKEEGADKKAKSRSKASLGASRYSKQQINAIHAKIDRINKKLGIEPKLK